MLLFHGQPRVIGYLLWLRILQVFTDEMVRSEVVVMVPTQMQRVALPFVGNPACGVVEGWGCPGQQGDLRTGMQWLQGVWLKQPGRSWISFYRHFFWANLSLPGVKDWSIDEKCFLKVFSSSSLVSIKETINYETDISYPLLCIKWSNILENSKGSFWDTFNRKKNTSKIRPNSTLFLRVDQWKKNTEAMHWRVGGEVCTLRVLCAWGGKGATGW